jgi:SpoU rRNA methylase family enzyme
MAKKAVEALCLRPVVNQDDVAAVAKISANFKASNFSLKSVYADAAVHCSK